MHAHTEHLLSLRDGEPVAANVSEHVKACSICSDELQRLSSIRAEMQGLPQFEPPAVAWERIQQAIPERRTQLRWKNVGLAAAVTVAITITAIAFITSNSDRSSTSAPKKAEASTQDVMPHLEELVAQSQRLEGLLRKLPERPRVERVSTAATIDTIEQRIQWLDFQLSTAPDAQLSDEQSRRLWRERVDLMDSLVKVRYAEAGGVWF